MRERVIIIQQASGPYCRMLDVSGHLHASYCKRNQAVFWAVRGDVQVERTPHWNKIRLLQKALELDFDLVAWLDADALIVNPAEDIRLALPEGAHLGMCKHQLAWKSQPWHYNAGVIVARNTPSSREFFDEVWRAGPTDHPWFEQARILEVADALTFRDKVKVLPDKWNSTFHMNDCADPVIRAWHGRGAAALEFMQKAALGLSSCVI